MNWKSLLEPTIDKICAAVGEQALAEIRGEERTKESGGWPREWVEAWKEGWEEGREEARMEDIKAWELRLQQQIRAGKLILHEELKLPEIYGPGIVKYITVTGEIREI